MRVLITGAGGLLGRALVRAGGVGLSHAELDVTDPDARDRALARLRPDAVVFCAAMTRVDACDDSSEALNVRAPIAWAQRVPTWFISSNYVFSGPGPHLPHDPPEPVGAYARQKAAAEQGVLQAGGHVVRTGWLYGLGGRNFPSQIAHLLRAGPVKALADWPVQPTWAPDLAQRLMTLPEGVSHAIGSQETTWAEFTLQAAHQLGFVDRVQVVNRVDLGPRPRDARLSPATLPGWRERLPLHIGEG